MITPVGDRPGRMHGATAALVLGYLRFTLATNIAPATAKGLELPCRVTIPDVVNQDERIRHGREVH